jgi:beta-phosphoglucomutase
MNSRIKGLIFDLDGVLVTTEHNHFIAWKNTAEILGIPFNEQDNEQLKGISRVDSLKKILDLGNKSISDETFNELLTKKNEYYLNSIADINQSNLLPGVLSVLKKAQLHGLKCAVGSSSKNARFILSKLQIDSYFSVIVDGNDVSFPKPHPEVFLKGAQQMGLEPFECIVFEDAKSGVQAAKEGGFTAIGVGNPTLIDFVDSYLLNLNEFSLEEYA